MKKVRPIFQKEGTWIDAANQLRFNRNFIQEEAVGYGKAKYPNLTWNNKESKCIRDVGLILDAYEHDLRFGGNSASHYAATEYFNETTVEASAVEIYKYTCLLYTSPSPRDLSTSRMPSSA